MVVKNLKETGIILLITFFFFLSLPSCLTADESKLIRVGYFEKKPLVFTDTDGDVKGFGVDILKDIARDNDWDLKFLKGTLGLNLELLNSGDIELMMPVGYTVERDQVLDYVEESLLDSWGCIYTLNRSGIQSIEDLEGKRIAYLNQSLLLDTFQGMLDNLDVQSDLIPLETHEELFHGLISEAYDCILSEQLALFSFDADVAKEVEQAIIFHPFSIFAAVKKGDPLGLMNPINQYLLEGKSGTEPRYSENRNFWLSSQSAPASVMATVVMFSLIIMFAFFVLYTLLRIPAVRAGLGMTERVQHKVSTVILILTVFFTASIWFADAAIEFYVFRIGPDFQETLFPQRTSHNIVSRGLMAAIVLFFGILISRIFARLAKQHDITKKQEERLDLALQAANDGIWDWRLDSNTVFFDDRYYVMVGYKPGDFPCSYKEWEKRIHPDHCGAVLSAVEEYLSGKRDVYDMEFPFLKKDGSYLWIRSRGKIVSWDEAGGPVRFIGTQTDIAQRKAVEKKLVGTRAYLTNVIDAMPSIIIGVDEKGLVTQWNIMAEESFGIHHLDAMGSTLAGLFDEPILWMDQVGDSIRRQEIKHLLKQPRSAGKNQFYEDLTIYPVILDDSKGAVIRIDDVTEKVRLEEMLIQSEKMLSIGGLAAGMAHEINNPLAGMLQTSEVMAHRLEGGSEIEGNIRVAEELGLSMTLIDSFMAKRGIPRMIDSIRQSGERISQIVNNMLSFSRKGESFLSSSDLCELVNRTLELAATDYDLKKLYDFKMIRIRKEYAPDLPPVPCEMTKIQQVFLNLFRNAAQAMQENESGESRLVIRINREPLRDMVRIEVEDNGPGMDDATRKRIFEPFFTTKPVGIGTGLGLSVSYFIIVENHRGEMMVESRLGRGTKFIICLPV